SCDGMGRRPPTRILYGYPRLRAVGPFEELMGEEDPLEDETGVRLSCVLLRVGSKVLYTYDFGDCWEHSVVLEKRLPADPNMVYPVCTGGRCACPPEDCGGIPGFYDPVKVMGNPAHRRYMEMLDWFGGPYDPEAFSVDDVNRRITPRYRGKAR